MYPWWIFIILIIANVIILILDLWFLYYYMHKDDIRYTQGIAAQCVCLFGAQFAWLSFMILPTDAYNTYLYSDGGGFQSIYFWQITYTLMLTYLTIFLPFASFYYRLVPSASRSKTRYFLRADSDPRITKKSPFVRATMKTLVATAISWACIGILFGICHSTPQGPIPFLNFLVAVPPFFGWILFDIFGSIGIAATPIGVIYEFIRRPKPMGLQEYE